MKNQIPIVECYHALQGEGPDIGKPTIFVRVFGCNMSKKCPWCDSMYAVKKENNTIVKDVSVETIVNTIIDFDCNDVTFTGGEPLIYIEQIKKVMQLLSLNNDYKFHFETNGLICPEKIPDYNITYVVSPKFHIMNLKEDMHLKKDCNEYIGVLRKWCSFMKNSFCFKFVYEGSETIKNIKLLRRMLMGNDIDVPIYLMPEGVEFDKVKYQACAAYCIENGYIMTPRLHIILYGNKRGV